MAKVLKAKEGNKLSRILKSIVRVLGKMKDSYMQGITECSGKFDYGAPCLAGPTVYVTSLPRSYSVSSTKTNDDEDFRELVRAASRRSLENKVKADLLRKQQVVIASKSPMGGGGGGLGFNKMPRSQSVGIGRIDEDSPCEFEGNHVKVKTEFLYPRSRSYAVSNRSFNAL